MNGKERIKMTIQKTKRKHPVHNIIFKENQPVIVFLTVCTKDRKKWLGEDRVHKSLREIWTNASGWLVGKYIIMPDHLHLFAFPGELEISLNNWVKYWKSQYSKTHKISSHRWQTDYWDTQLRTSEHYEEKWEYMRYNPVRHGFVSSPENWPYQGEIHKLLW